MLAANVYSKLSKCPAVFPSKAIRGFASLAADSARVPSGISCSPWTSLNDAAALLKSKAPEQKASCRVLDLDVLNPNLPVKVIKGAVQLPEDFHPALKSCRDGTHVMEPDEMQALAGDLGLCASQRVLVADMMGCMPSARVWWALRAYGFKGASILAGSKVSLWATCGDDLADSVPCEVCSEEQQAADGEGAGGLRLDPDWVATLPQVQAAARGSSENKCTILDVRSAAEFSGADVRGGNPRGGHAPGAVNIPHEEFLEPSSQWPAVPLFKDSHALQSMLQSRDFPSPSEAGRVIVMCQSGMRAAVPLPGLYQLGYDVALYDGSMAEYCRHPDSPLA